MSTGPETEKQALHRAADVLGGQAALAAVCGYPDRRHVWPWFHTDRKVPAEKCPAIEEATRAKGDVVTCEQLRPDAKWVRVKGRPLIDFAEV